MGPLATFALAAARLHLLAGNSDLASSCQTASTTTSNYGSFKRGARSWNCKLAHSLMQQEQAMIVEASSSSSMPAQGSLSLSRPEDRARPLACIKGRGRYLNGFLQYMEDTI